MPPIVYIILPVYNGEKYLLQQLMSIYYQDYKNWHLIIINDGSTDSTKSIINEFIADYGLGKKITIINQSNSGVNKSVEHGLIRASNLAKESGNTDAYVTFCDADDLLMTNKLSYQINFMEAHKDYDLSYHDLVLIDENNSIISLSYLKTLNKNPLTNVKCDKFYEYAMSNHIPSNTPMFRVGKIELLLPFPKICPFHDRWTSLVFSGSDCKIVNLGRCLGFYRKYSSGTSESGKKYNLDKTFKEFVVSLEELKKKVDNKNRMKEIDEYVNYYMNRVEWEQENKSMFAQIIRILFKHPKIIIYKILSYLKG